MNRNLFWLSVPAIAAVLLCHVPAVRAAEPPVEPGPEIRRLTLDATPEPVPALKYQLLPDLVELTPGNAATLYYKAMSFEGPDLLQQFDKTTEKWSEMKAAELPLAEVAEALRPYESMLNDIQRATYCDHCRWDDEIRTKGYMALLPHIQKIRSVARVLSIKARLEIGQGKFDDAISTLRTNFALARHCAEGESLIHALVGMAITGMATDDLKDFASAPGAPNLYWALTALPQPLIDVRKGMAAERQGLYFSIPEMRQIESRRFTPQEVYDLAEKVASFGNSFPLPGGARRFVLAAWTMQHYPEARSYLLAQGWSSQKLEDMPTLQVIAIFFRRQYENSRDDVFKWSFIPSTGNDATDKRLGEAYQNVERRLRETGNPFFEILPAVQAVHKAELRSTRRIDLLRVIEALRLYAAAQHGRLPASLINIQEVPISIDALTGKPFDYRLNAETATIELPSSNDNGQRYELTIRQK